MVEFNPAYYELMNKLRVFGSEEHLELLQLENRGRFISLFSQCVDEQKLAIVHSYTRIVEDKSNFIHKVVSDENAWDFVMAFGANALIAKWIVQTAIDQQYPDSVLDYYPHFETDDALVQVAKSALNNDEFFCHPTLRARFQEYVVAHLSLASADYKFKALQQCAEMLVYPKYFKEYLDENKMLEIIRKSLILLRKFIPNITPEKLQITTDFEQMFCHLYNNGALEDRTHLRVCFQLYHSANI